MIDKIQTDLRAAVAPISDGASIAVGGFGDSGIPYELLGALLEHGASELTIIANNAGTHASGIAALLLAGRVRRIVCSHPRPPHSEAFAQVYASGRLEYECVPQGTLAERLRAGGAGLGPFFTPTGYGTRLAEGKETRVIDGIGYVLEAPLRPDFALVRAHRADRWGNLVYRLAARNFNPVMATAARHTIAQVDALVSLGELAPADVTTPGAFVATVVPIGAHA